jgi:hypothetical protein
MSPAGFETAIPASERPQTHALDRAATVIADVMYTGVLFLACLFCGNKLGIFIITLCVCVCVCVCVSLLVISPAIKLVEKFMDFHEM